MMPFIEHPHRKQHSQFKLLQSEVDPWVEEWMPHQKKFQSDELIHLTGFVFRMCKSKERLVNIGKYLIWSTGLNFEVERMMHDSRDSDPGSTDGFNLVLREMHDTLLNQKKARGNKWSEKFLEIWDEFEKTGMTQNQKEGIY